MVSLMRIHWKIKFGYFHQGKQDGFIDENSVDNFKFGYIRHEKLVVFTTQQFDCWVAWGFS